MTNTATPEKGPDTKVAPTPVDVATEAFIDEIRKKGLHHVFYWIEGHMLKYVEASYQTAIAEAIKQAGPGLSEKERQTLEQLVLLGAMRPELESVNAQSNQIGATYLRRAQVAVAAKMLRYGDVGRSPIDQALQAMQTELQAGRDSRKAKS